MVKERCSIRSVKPLQDKSVIMSGGGTHLKFYRSNGKWIFFGPAICQWIS